MSPQRANILRERVHGRVVEGWFRQILEDTKTQHSRQECCRPSECGWRLFLIGKDIGPERGHLAGPGRAAGGTGTCFTMKIGMTIISKRGTESMRDTGIESGTGTTEKGGTEPRFWLVEGLSWKKNCWQWRFLSLFKASKGDGGLLI